MRMLARMLQIFHDALFPPRATALLVRSCRTLPLSVREIESHTHALALLPYHQPHVQASVIEAKFHRNARAQQLLGQTLASYLASYIEEFGALSGTIHLVPVPLSRARLRARGYNQVDLVCREALTRLPGSSLTYHPNLLTRVRDTAPQTTLNRSRRLQNMQGAFDLSTGLSPLSAHDTYIIVDDVATTGSTLAAAKQALRAAGAKHIELLTFAH